MKENIYSYKKTWILKSALCLCCTLFERFQSYFKYSLNFNLTQTKVIRLIKWHFSFHLKCFTI